MALDHYGVLIGPFVEFHRDPVKHEGKYLHGHVVVGAEHLDIDCAVDCNHADKNVRYVHLKNLDVAKLGPVAGFADGFHALASTPSSGAIDYARSPLISLPLGCAAIVFAILDRLTGGHHSAWTTNVGDGAIAALQAMMTPPVDRVLVYGDRWQNAQQTPNWGMHDIHCNQGDPPGPYQHLDGVWQDGGVIVRRPDGTYDGFFVMFTTQTLDTDDVTGLPN